MGCGCGSNKEQKTEAVVARSTVSKVRESIKKVWAATQPDTPVHVVKRINKKN
tara:strand:- start:411 stop:569 length:159 start_codon:yes stop_codon:yes gene_type:complete